MVGKGAWNVPHPKLCFTLNQNLIGMSMSERHTSELISVYMHPSYVLVLNWSRSNSYSNSHFNFIRVHAMPDQSDQQTACRRGGIEWPVGTADKVAHSVTCL